VILDIVDNNIDGSQAVTDANNEKNNGSQAKQSIDGHSKDGPENGRESSAVTGAGLGAGSEPQRSERKESSKPGFLSRSLFSRSRVS